MIIMNVKIDNFYSFNNFEINFSYPRKLINSTIEYEYLKDIPNFKFKKLNIIMGSNATGKTTFGKILMNIFNFIKNYNLNLLEDSINDKEKKAKFEIDLVLKQEKYTMYRLSLSFFENEIKELKLSEVKLNKFDSYEKAINRLKEVVVYDSDNKKGNIIDVLKKIRAFGWLFTFAGQKPNFGNNDIKDLRIASNILKSFDNSIIEIRKVEDSPNGYNIIFKNGENVLVQNGKATNNGMLSSGTEEAVGIIFAIDKMIINNNMIFYIDEKCSHIHSELEKSILSLALGIIIDKESQLFFTTHNLDILNMNLPTHSFMFFSKNDEGNIEVKYPEKYIKRNDRNLINYVNNDVFDTVPSTELIDSILSDNYE